MQTKLTFHTRHHFYSIQETSPNTTFDMFERAKAAPPAVGPRMVVRSFWGKIYKTSVDTLVPYRAPLLTSSLLLTDAGGDPDLPDR